MSRRHWQGPVVGPPEHHKMLQGRSEHWRVPGASGAQGSRGTPFGELHGQWCYWDAQCGRGIREFKGPWSSWGSPWGRGALGAPGGNGQGFRGAWSYWQWELQEDGSHGGHFVRSCQELGEHKWAKTGRGARQREARVGQACAMSSPCCPQVLPQAPHHTVPKHGHEDRLLPPHRIIE